MGDLKPIGSEKLQGQEKIKRILELAYYQNNDNDNKIVKKHEYITEGVNGCFGIDKEKDGYYVKKGLTEDTLDYIGGMFMKNKNKFGSYGDALKRLELLKSVELNEGTKYVLKQAASEPAPEPIPASEPAPEIPPIEDTDIPTDDIQPDEEGIDDNDPIKSIQKLTGKLGQKLRDFDADLESEDIKFVLNSIISAVDITKISDEDKDDILNNFDENESDDFNAETDEINPEGDDSELAEIDDDYGFSEMKELIDTPFEFDEADEFEDEEFEDDTQANSEYSDYTNDELGDSENDIDASELDNVQFKDEQIYDNSELDEFEGDEAIENEASNIDIEKLTNFIVQAVKASLK
ncbi:hypothetical protein M0Q97_06230 [Candidatus Dojkabacteria bacterium]|jgi:hypothetical protein|nr:hypothetical protein [Candidatus Dojkabacteria bacterium]